MAGFTMTKRTLGVVVAASLSGVAALSLATYVRGAESRALEGVETTRAWVAQELIPAGTTGAAALAGNLIVQTAIPRKVVAEGSIRSPQEIRERVAAVNILKGEQILAARFTKPTEVRGILPIPADRQAMSVEVGIPPGVAGFVQPGDRVSIVAQLELEQRGQREAQVQYLLQSIQVLAVGQRVVSVEGKKGEAEVSQNQQRVLLTLALTPVEVEKLSFALFQGQVQFTLLPPGQEPASTPGRNRGNAFS